MISARADFGGGPEHVRKVLVNLQDQVDFYVACPRDYPYWDIYAELLGTGRLLEIPHRAFHFKTALTLAKACKVHGITLIHSHGKGAGIYSRVVGWISGMPVIHTPHGLHLERYGSFGRWMYLAIEKYLSGPFSKVIFVSPSEKDNAVNRFRIWRGKGVVIINGVADVDDAEVSRWRTEVRAELSLDEATPVVITVSRFDPAKNMQEAVSVAEELKDMVFVWIGDGEGQTEVEEALRKRGIINVKMLGARSDVIRLLSSADMYLSTSLREGMPIAVLEAMSVGLPIVASRVVGNVDVVNDGKNGFLYSSGHPAEAAALLSQLKETELRMKMGVESLRLQRNQYSATVMARNIYSEYLNVVEAKENRSCA